jgi:hypothetical protein
MGSIRLDLNCTTTRETSYCVQASTDTGARPSIRINTTLLPGPLNASAACTANSEVYQSWRLEKWFQQYEVSSWLVQPPSDIGPSFTLRSMANSDVFSCATLSRQNLTFHGTCKALAGSSSTSTGFRFDDQLNILTIYERWNCSSLT